jgi:hypothetical protein
VAELKKYGIGGICSTHARNPTGVYSENVTGTFHMGYVGVDESVILD